MRNEKSKGWLAGFHTSYFEDISLVSMNTLFVTASARMHGVIEHFFPTFIENAKKEAPQEYSDIGSFPLQWGKLYDLRPHPNFEAKA